MCCLARRVGLSSYAIGMLKELISMPRKHLKSLCA